LVVIPIFMEKPGAARSSEWTSQYLGYVHARIPQFRMLLQPEPGFYVMRCRSGAPLISALIYQACPMVLPQPGTVGGPNPDEWCRRLDRSPSYGALIDGKP